MKPKWRIVFERFAWVRFPVTSAVFHVNVWLMAQAIAIGDTANPVLPMWLSLALELSTFPAGYLLFPKGGVGDWLKPYLTDNGVLELSAALNAAFWVWILGRLLSVRVTCSNSSTERSYAANNMLQQPGHAIHAQTCFNAKSA